ncbi:HNH endonuclease signature motif containing protein [Salinicola sp. CPA57]|uniref:HNH endonuclease signature motif containing protein n=1 Tax=Salinicola sp. CPA57 TaxID=1949080 RepID=UPI0013006054|nr:HNH endonuclease signature motif containing protein [Salinicola sp. CPA57]
MKNHGKPWSNEDLEALKKHYPDTGNATLAKIFRRSESSIKNTAQTRGLKKSDAFIEANRPGQFRKGQQPWNKGTHFQAGGRSEKTRFKAGQRGNRHVPIGTERVTPDGILQRKIRDTNYAPQNWRAVHAIEWEKRNGPIPPGHFVRFKNGNRRDFTPDNLELVSRTDNMLRNSLHRYPEEIVQVIQLRGAINRQINQRIKANEESH